MSFRHSPSEHIQQIRNDLRDRYSSGFPILKELLQNADDAGAEIPGSEASQCVIVLCPIGLSEGKHVLLKGAGLCLINDGDFTPGDANSINSYGLSNRGGQVGTAGKFGLGLKSIFHWAEAFFYFSPQTFPSDGKKQSHPFDFQNPWFDRYTDEGLHRDWDAEWIETSDQTGTQKADFNAFKKVAGAVVGETRWFGLWIPFRTEEQTKDVPPIEKRFPKPDFYDLFGEDWLERVVEALPLLRRIRTVRFGIWRDGGFVEECSAMLAAQSSRMSYGTASQVPPTFERQSVTGTLKVVGSQDGDIEAGYVGLEQLSAALSIDPWISHKYWPSRFVQKAGGGEEQVKEKAAPHGTSVFIRRRTRRDSSLKVQHAVFLPLGEPEVVKCPGEWSYSLFLHGFFFVDSGRTHMEDFADVPDNFTLGAVNLESQIIKLWNRTLMKEVVAPLVLPSLESFVRGQNMAGDETEALVGALVRSETLREYKEWICHSHRFLYRLHASGGKWLLEKADHRRWITLPKPSFSEADLFRLFPALKEVCVETSVTFRGKPYLTCDKAASPGEDEIARLLTDISASIFGDAEQLCYLLELVPDDSAEREPNSSLTSGLVRLCNSLLGLRLPDDPALNDLWHKFFKRLPSDAFIRLPCDSSTVRPEIASVLAGGQLPTALLWQDFLQAEGQGTSAWKQLLPLLRQFGGIAVHDEQAIKQRSAITMRLLESCEDQPQGWLDQIAELPLFDVREVGGKTFSASVSELRTSHSEERLFTGGESWAKDLAKAAPVLKPLFVDGPVAKLVGISASACDGAACVKLLCRATRLAADFASRKPLFDRILAAADQVGVGAWSALRCLLHGDLSAWEQTDKLFREGGDNAVFVRLVRQALDVTGQPWRLIPSIVASQLALTADQEQQLNLSATSAKNVEGLLKEVGPERVDCADLSREECGFLLLQFNDVDVLRGLNIHETLDRRQVCIGKHTYVDDGSFRALPSELDDLVTRIHPNHGYARFTSPELVPKLDWEPVICIALEQPQPELYCDTILTAIGKRGTLRTELKAVVFSSRWLKMADGTAVTPSVLLHVPGAEDELCELPDDILAGLIPVKRLTKEVQQHQSFSTFKSTILPPAKESITMLVTLLQPHTAYSTGLSGEWSSEQTNDWVQTLGVADGELSKELAVAPLAKALHGQVPEYLPTFLQALGSKLSTNAYAVVLKHLAACHETDSAEARPIFERVFLRYLNAIADGGAEFARSVIKTEGIRFLSAEQRWKPPFLLTFATANIDAGDRLDPRFEQRLRIMKPGRLDCVRVPDAHDLGKTDAEIAKQLRQFFAPWRQIDMTLDPVGAFLTLLGTGPAMRSLAQEFFTTSSRTAILDWMEQQDRSGLVPLKQRLESRHFVIETVSGSHVWVVSLLETKFEAKLSEGLDTLLVDDGLEVDFEQEPVFCRIHLRCFSIRADTPSDGSLIALRAVTQHVLRVALRCDVDVGPLFEQLSRANQLHVRIAQNLVVDAALAFLRQIGAQQNADVRRVLMEWDEARRQIAEAEENKRPVPKTAQGLLQTAKQQLRELLTANAQTQTQMLAGVRRKIGEFDYSGSSVPFEVWQNADDAVAELERLGVGSERAKELGFVVMHSSDLVDFAHWGRPINEFQGSAGLNLRSAGFDRDLEKMLVQAISDKGDAAQQGGPALTGKFGLGFKSVFLVSDAPEILSANVDFVTRGGIYPVRLKDAQRNELFASLQAIAPNDARRGTVIRLPLRTANADDVLGLFRQLAPVLVIFSRRLKRLRFWEDGNVQRELQWQPKTLHGGQCEFGKLSAPLADVTGALTLLSALDAGGDRLTFLLGLNHDGFAALPSHVPVFWVTAPTRDTSGYGFAVNGPFEPNVGRVHLVESEKNKRLAKGLSEVVSTRFTALWNWAEADWEAVRRELNLGLGASRNSVWASLWQVLGVHFSEKCRKDDKSIVAELARCVLWGPDATGMRHFYSACAALPTGLWGEHRALTKLGKVHFVVSGALDRKSVFGTISGWKAFQQRVAVGAICSGSQVASVLERLGVSLREVEMVHLATVVEWELGEEKRADADLAAHLGELITTEFMTGLEKGQAGEREESEHKRLVGLLRDVSFQAADGSWHKASKLVVAAPATVVAKDELMRAAFAPRDCQLNPAYTGTALLFFLASRARLEADVEQMAEWVLKASDQTTQVAALHYLLDGDLRHALADGLRPQRDAEKWLWKLESFDWFKTEFSEDQRLDLLAHVLKLFEKELGEMTGEEQRSETQQPPPKHIWTVEELWKWWEREGKPMGDYTLEGEANWDLFHGGPIWRTEERREELKRLLRSDDPTERNPLWYRLFGYACLVSAGRHTTELRNFWTGQLDPERFWDRTSTGEFSEETKDIFTRAVSATFTDLNAGGEAAYFWRRVFYDIRKIHRMVCVNHFPADLMRLVEEGHGQHLPNFLRTGHLPGQPAWAGTFGQSAGSPLFFVIRELVRLKVITDEAVRPLAFSVSTPVRRALRKIGWWDDEDTGVPDFQELHHLSQWLHDKIMSDPEFGPKLLPYFDIPLLHMGITHRGQSMPVPPQ